MKKKQKLDTYEKEIEVHFNGLKPAKNAKKLKEKLELAAKDHLRKKRSITIRVSEYDLEAIKIKASKAGMAYQTYINTLIHADAVALNS